MDPILLGIIVTLFVLATGGASTAAARRMKRSQERQKLKENLRARRRIGDQRLGIFDVFWDLGASDYALELLAHHSLLPEGGTDEELYSAWSRLEDMIEQHGNYEGFLEDSLEAIQEFFEEHRHAGHRRRLPGLTAAARRIIPVPHRLESDNLPARSDEISRTSDGAPPSVQSLRERRELRAGGGNFGLYEQPSHDEIDIDQMGNVKPLELLQAVLDGSLGNRIEQWWKMRRLRQLRTELDDTLTELYRFYADTARRVQDFYKPLYDAHQRWRDETTRLRITASHRPWAKESFELTADVLYELAINLADHLAQRAYGSTYNTIETIHHHAREDNLPMAGYLVYLNRHPFFAGRYPEYAERATKIEYATHRVQQEILRLRDEGVV